MTDWLLLGGLVVLDEMGQWSFWRLLLVTPVTLTAICLLIPWRISEKRARVLMAGLYGLLWINFLLCHSSGAPQPFTGQLGSVVKGSLEYVAFPLLFTRYRDFRVCFLMLTLGVISFQSESVASLLLGGIGPSSTALALTAVIFALLLAYFVRRQRAAIWDLMAHQSKGWFKFCSIPTLVGCMFFLFRCYPDPLSTTVQNPIGLVLVSLLHPVVYQVLFSALDAQRRQAQLEQNAAVLQVQVSMMEEHGRQMEHRSREEAVARHDRRHFQQILLAYLDTGDTEGARSMLQEQLARGEPARADYCEDPVLNQLLAHYARWAQEEQTGLQAQVHLPGGTEFRRTELMVALCNTLENALHACSQVPDPRSRRITVTLTAKGRQVYLEVSNTYAGALSLDPDSGLPRTDAPGHGYGLESIAALASHPPVCSASGGVFTIWMLI